MYVLQATRFRYLGSFDHIDKNAEHRFVDLARQQKKELLMMWQKESRHNNI